MIEKPYIIFKNRNGDAKPTINAKKILKAPFISIFKSFRHIERSAERKRSGIRLRHKSWKKVDRNRTKIRGIKIRRNRSIY